ncbi:RNA 2',3'-cyclic phosphodiesterase [uncultured Corynebacterium sp.]|uniref:RNA 2',3'-cyclic phosphodiesterase n=1 Tax=uncultured Corynebacterium sp. TaxID=159447 RepID=UPI0025D8D6ED|nr:RNA 2',3'-cyclic phosphodiesterase [uncultured Corynebacterium sp.]
MRLFASIRPPEEVREHLVTALRPVRDDVGPSLRWTDPDQWHLTTAFYGERPDGAVDELAAHLASAAAGTGAMDLHLRGAGSFSGRTLWIGVGGDVADLRGLMADCEHDPLLAGAGGNYADTDDGDFDRGDGGRGSADSMAGTRSERRRAHLTVARSRAREQGGRGSSRRGNRRGDRGARGARGERFDRGDRGARDVTRPARHDGADLLRDVVHALSVYRGPAWTATEIELVRSRLGEGRSGGALHETVATIPLGR